MTFRARSVKCADRSPLAILPTPNLPRPRSLDSPPLSANPHDNHGRDGRRDDRRRTKRHTSRNHELFLALAPRQPARHIEYAKQQERNVVATRNPPPTYLITPGASARFP